MYESEVNGMGQPNRRRTNVREQAVRSAGRPVVVTLVDGRQYVGTVARISCGQIYLTGVEVPAKRKNGSRQAGRSTAQARRRTARSLPPARRQVRTSSFLLPKFLGAGAGGGAAGAGGAGGAGGAAGAAEAAEETSLAAQANGAQGDFGLGGLTDWMSFMEKAMPMIKMGMGVVKSIIPLLNALKV
ncbi:hypothetical protein [Cohnella fermenti]|uniref:hypothetical protein n=1 Tax=Cohnella fermenti TaxID=2565925 RepID=UPI001B3B24D8|nr:hypothetical protein [Cohnella fermenti]